MLCISSRDFALALSYSGGRVCPLFCLIIYTTQGIRDAMASDTQWSKLYLYLFLTLVYILTWLESYLKD